MQETHLIKDYYLKYAKKLQSPRVRKQTTQFKNRPKSLTGISPKKLHRWKISIWKDTPYHMSSRKRKVKMIIMRYHYVPKTMAKIQNTHNTQCWVTMGSYRNSHSLGWEYKMMQPFCKTIWSFLTKQNILLAYDPANVLLHIYPKELKALFPHKNVHINI